MKTSFKNDEELAHYWANNDCTYTGKSRGSMFFDRDKIYSYGYHFVIAQKVRNAAGNVVFVAFNSNGYSMTTNKHKWMVRRALFQHVIEMPGADIDSARFAEYCAKSVKESLVAQGTARTEHTKSEHANAAVRHINNWNTYVVLMKQADKKVDKLTRAQKLVLGAAGTVDLEAVREAEEKAVKKAVADKKKRANLLHAQELQILDDWKAGKRENLPYLQTIYDTALRIHDGKVETSRNASVSVEAAKTLWKLIEAGRDVKGHVVDGYTVISMNGVLKVGCHVIDKSEVERIGAMLND